MTWHEKHTEAKRECKMLRTRGNNRLSAVVIEDALDAMYGEIARVEEHEAMQEATELEEVCIG